VKSPLIGEIHGIKVTRAGPARPAIRRRVRSASGLQTLAWRPGSLASRLTGKVAWQDGGYLAGTGVPG
jgi:hypothetical protein